MRIVSIWPMRCSSGKMFWRVKADGRAAGGLELGIAATALGNRALLVVADVQLQQGLKPLRGLGGFVEIPQSERPGGRVLPSRADRCEPSTR